FRLYMRGGDGRRRQNQKKCGLTALWRTRPGHYKRLLYLFTVYDDNRCQEVIFGKGDKGYAKTMGKQREPRGALGKGRPWVLVRFGVGALPVGVSWNRSPSPGVFV